MEAQRQPGRVNWMQIPEGTSKFFPSTTFYLPSARWAQGLALPPVPGPLWWWTGREQWREGVHPMPSLWPTVCQVLSDANSSHKNSICSAVPREPHDWREDTPRERSVVF